MSALIAWKIGSALFLLSLGGVGWLGSTQTVSQEPEWEERMAMGVFWVLMYLVGAGMLFLAAALGSRYVEWLFT